MKFVIAMAALAVFVMPEAGQAQAERRETSAGPVEVNRMVGGLDTPWAIAFLPDGAQLITERGGRLLLPRDDHLDDTVTLHATHSASGLREEEDRVGRVHDKPVA